jgi:SAM-dependent methyltransferase
MHPCVAGPTDPALSFRDYLGLRIVEHLALRPGMHVLDACHVVGGVRVPPVRNAQWHHASLTTLPHAADEFDVVMCAFGIFTADDMTAATRRLWALVRPGGRLLIATWSERLFEPANSAFWDAVRQVRPSLVAARNAWDAVATPESLADVLAAAGIPAGEIKEERYEHPLPSPRDWWTIVLGTHYRTVVEQLAPVERNLVEVLTRREIVGCGVEWINASALFAVARK